MENIVLVGLADLNVCEAPDAIQNISLRFLCWGCAF